MYYFFVSCITFLCFFIYILNSIKPLQEHSLNDTNETLSFTNFNSNTQLDSLEGEANGNTLFFAYFFRLYST